MLKLFVPFGCLLGPAAAPEQAPRRLARLLCLLLGCMLVACVRPVRAAQPVQARTAPPSPAPAPPSEQMVLVPSVFEQTLYTGKDPFFPRSERIKPLATAAAPSAPLPDLTLKGFSVVGAKRFAMINNYTLETGEEAEIKAAGRIYKIRCVEIRENSVLINYKGLIKELTLPQGH